MWSQRSNTGNMPVPAEFYYIFESDHQSNFIKKYSKKNLRHFNFKDFYKSETEEVLMGKKQIVQLGKIAKMS